MYETIIIISKLVFIIMLIIVGILYFCLREIINERQQKINKLTCLKKKRKNSMEINEDIEDIDEYM